MFLPSPAHSTVKSRLALVAKVHLQRNRKSHNDGLLRWSSLSLNIQWSCRVAIHICVWVDILEKFPAVFFSSSLRWSPKSWTSSSTHKSLHEAARDSCALPLRLTKQQKGEEGRRKEKEERNKKRKTKKNIQLICLKYVLLLLYFLLDLSLS